MIVTPEIKQTMFEKIKGVPENYSSSNVQLHQKRCRGQTFDENSISRSPFQLI